MLWTAATWVGATAAGTITTAVGATVTEMPGPAVWVSVAAVAITAATGWFAHRRATRADVVAERARVEARIDAAIDRATAGMRDDVAALRRETRDLRAELEAERQTSQQLRRDLTEERERTIALRLEVAHMRRQMTAAGIDPDA